MSSLYYSNSPLLFNTIDTTMKSHTNRAAWKLNHLQWPAQNRATRKLNHLQRTLQFSAALNLQCSTNSIVDGLASDVLSCQANSEVTVRKYHSIPAYIPLRLLPMCFTNQRSSNYVRANLLCSWTTLEVRTLLCTNGLWDYQNKKETIIHHDSCHQFYLGERLV